MRRKWKRLFAKALVFAMCLNLAAAANVNAAYSDEQKQNAQIFEGAEPAATGNDSIGNLLADVVNGELEKQQESEGCNIFSIEVEGSTAYAEFETAENAELVVVVYDESGVEMLASGSMNVYAGEQHAVVDLAISDMPQYFYLRGFLIDPNGLRAVCPAYESPNYTKDMQEFLATTTEDYEMDRVLNFDAKKDTNFAVYADDTVLLDAGAGDVNQVTVVDEEQKIYRIEYADETVLALEEGDIFSCTLEDGSILIVKVGTVSIDGTTVTITGAEDVDMQEVFSYVKIEETLGMEDVQVDDSTCEAGVVYVGLVDDTENQAASYGMERAGVTETKSMAYEFANKKFGSGNATVSLNGNLNLRFDNTFEYYLTLSNTYLALKTDYKGTVTIDLEGHAKGDVTLGTLTFTALGVLNLTFTPKILFEANAKINITGTLTGTVGFSCSVQEGLQNLTTTPKFQADLTAEADLYVGMELKPSINLVSDHLAETSMTAKVGAQVMGKLVMSTAASADIRHDCTACLDGDVYGKYSVAFQVKLLDKDWLTYTYNAVDKTVKVLDFYYSVGRNEFALTSCPHITYLVTVTVKDSAGNPVSGAAVNGSYITDSNGQTALYLANGSQTLTASKDGYALSKTIAVDESAQSVVLSLSGQVSGSGNGSFDGTNQGEIKQISLGGSHSAAVTKDGSLYTWGHNDDGQLGDGTAADKYLSVKITNNDIVGYLKENSVSAVSLGGDYSAAVTKDGSLYTWGNNIYGQLGDGTTMKRSRPVKVMENVLAVSLRGGGTVRQ